MVALLVHRMFTYEHADLPPRDLREWVAGHFLTAYLATENSGDATRNAAQAVATEIGARFHNVSIQEPFDLHQTTVAGKGTPR